MTRSLLRAFMSCLNEVAGGTPRQEKMQGSRRESGYGGELKGGEVDKRGKKDRSEVYQGGGKKKWEMGVLSQTPPTPEMREELKACRLVARLVTNQSNKNRQSK